MDLNAILALIPARYLGYISAVIAVAAALTAALPPPADRSTLWGRIYSVLDFVALNIGHGKTAAKLAAETAVIVPAPHT
jgi:hypothetical protein